jgi:hypothetical protein
LLLNYPRSPAQVALGYFPDPLGIPAWPMIATTVALWRDDPMTRARSMTFDVLDDSQDRMFWLSWAGTAVQLGRVCRKPTLLVLSFFLKKKQCPDVYPVAARRAFSVPEKEKKRQVFSPSPAARAWMLDVCVTD